MAHPGKTVERMEEGAPLLAQGSELLASRWREAVVAAVASRNFERAMRGSGINLRMSRQPKLMMKKTTAKRSPYLRLHPVLHFDRRMCIVSCSLKCILPAKL
jgi:hypothetical protein